MDPSQHIERRPSKFVDENGVSSEGTLGASRDVAFSTLSGVMGRIGGLWQNCPALVLIGRRWR